MEAPVQTDELDHPDKKYLKISFESNSRVGFCKRNIVPMPPDFDAFKDKLARLYAIKEGTSFDCRIDEYHVNLPSDYSIIRDCGYVSVLCYDNSRWCVII